MLVSIYNLHLFDKLIYKGWVIKNNWGVLGGWIQAVEESKFQIDAKDVRVKFSQFQKHLRENDDWFNRFTIMSRFLSKALTYNIGEEKFILLWTALEIFPMKDTSNIRAISTCLGKILNMEANIIKEQLGIGRLYGLRCSLVHHGQFTLNETASFSLDDPAHKQQYKYQQSDTIARLEYIVREIMRYMCGLPYSGSLDQYLQNIPQGE